jgi:hypothetical protein
VATALESCADDLEQHERQRELEALTLEEASLESGYSYSTLEKKTRRGELENVGRKGRPRVRRVDLPCKARNPARTAPDLAAQVLQSRRESRDLAGT